MTAYLTPNPEDRVLRLGERFVIVAADQHHLSYRKVGAPRYDQFNRPIPPLSKRYDGNNAEFYVAVGAHVPGIGICAHAVVLQFGSAASGQFERMLKASRYCSIELTDTGYALTLVGPTTVTIPLTPLTRPEEAHVPCPV